MKVSQIINVIILLVLAAFITVWSVKSLVLQQEVEQEGWMTTGGIKFGELTNFDRTSVARINDRDAVIVFSGSEALLDWNEAEKHLDIELKKGSVLAATYAGDVVIDVLADDFAYVRSEKNIVYAELADDQSDLNVYALEHPSEVAFVSNGVVLNSIYLPTNDRMRVPKIKVQNAIAQLRLTKLSKEFPFYDVSEGDLSDEVLGEFENIKASYTENALVFVSDFKSQSELGPDTEGLVGTINQLYGDFKGVVTVMPHAQEKLVQKNESVMLTYSVTNYLLGDVAMGDYWLGEWKSLDHDVSSLKDFFTNLYFVLPGDDLYPVKAAIAEIIYPDGDVIYSLQNQYRDIETLLAESSKVEADEAYDAYKNEFEKVLNSGDFDDAPWLSVISREYMLLESLLRSNSIFYNVDSVALLGDLEEKILHLAGSSTDLDEERQAFVQSKIRFLENLFKFVVDDKVSIDDASVLASSLIYDAENYMDDIVTSTAVLKYFDAKLKSYDLAVDFMNSPEFLSYDSFDEGLADYAAKVSDLENLNAYIQNLRAGEIDSIVEVSLDDAMTEVAHDLLYAGIQYADLVPLEDVEYRLFGLEGARSGGYAFEANYDRVTKILYDVVVGDVRFSTGLLVENARDVIKSVMDGDSSDGDVTQSDSGSVAVGSSGSLVDSVALANVKKAFDDAGLSSSDFDFEILSLDENTFKFSGVMLENEIPVSGVYDADTKKVTDFVWELDGEEQALPATSLNSLSAALEATYSAF